MTRESDLYKDKIEVSLDGRQIFYLFFGGAVIVGLVFVLGVMVGRRVEARAHIDPAKTQTAADPLAALDRLEAKGMTFQSTLTGSAAPTEVEHAIADLEKARKAAAPTKKDGKKDGKVDAKSDVKIDAKSGAKADGKIVDAKVEGKLEAKADGRLDAKADGKLDAKVDGKADAKPDGKLDAKATAKADGKLDGKADAKATAKADGKLDGRADAKATAKPDAKVDGKLDAKADGKLDGKVEAKVDPKAWGKPDAKPFASADAKAPAKADGKLDAKTDGKSPAKPDDKAVAAADAKSDKKSDKPKKHDDDKAKFTLQLSSFQDRAEADAFVATIKAAGYQPYLTEAAVDGKGTFYRVRIGSYRSLDAANNAKSELDVHLKKPAQVTKL
jgi:cell division protein FtsN